MAPLDRPDDSPTSFDWLELDIDVDAAEVVEVDAADDDAEANVVDEYAVVAELTSLEDNVPPRTCASITAPLVEQQSVFSPQHHLSLSARPLHGVMRTFPNGHLDAHTLRQFLLATFLSVQKSTQNLLFD